MTVRPIAVLRRARARGIVAGVFALGLAPLAAAQGWHGSVALTSDYVFRGISQTVGDAALQADVHYEGPPGWFAGAWASSIEPGYDSYGKLELDLYAGWNVTFATDWSARATYVRYLYPDASAEIDYDYGEFGARLAWRDRVVGTVAWSPDLVRVGAHGYADRGNAFAYELALRQPFATRFAATVGGGWYDQPLGIEYGSWNIGFSCLLGPVELDLSHFWTGEGGDGVLGADAAGQRWALTALWRF